jgi:dTMP kinase
VIYVAFEGLDGCGKSTQARLLAERLGALRAHEPGGTPLGTELRRLLLSPGASPVGARAEALLMAADRAQLMDELVRPALAAGRPVVSDRSVYSSLAYQGAGRGLGVAAVRELNRWAVGGCWPDLVVVLDLAPGAAAAAGRLGPALDRMEQEATAFHDTVRRAYLELAAAEPERFLVLDGTRPVAELAGAIWDEVAGRIAR